MKPNYEWKRVSEPQLMVTHTTHEAHVKRAFWTGMKLGFYGGAGLVVWLRFLYWLCWELRI